MFAAQTEARVLGRWPFPIWNPETGEEETEFTPEQTEKIATSHRRGVSVQDIAYSWGVSPAAICTLLKITNQEGNHEP